MADGIPEERRGFVATVSSGVMAGGLLAGYGSFAWCAGRFLYPPNGSATAWQFVATFGPLEGG